MAHNNGAEKCLTAIERVELRKNKSNGNRIENAHLSLIEHSFCSKGTV